VAIVYSHSEEEQEVRRHIEFLQASGWMTDDLEFLDLEDLPDVRGLKAMRAGVNLKATGMEKSAENMFHSDRIESVA
jgi:hypothetical protein